MTSLEKYQAILGRIVSTQVFPHGGDRRKLLEVTFEEFYWLGTTAMPYSPHAFLNDLKSRNVVVNIVKPQPLADLGIFLDGSVELSRPTGKWSRGHDGRWSEIYTDTITRNGKGEIIRVDPSPHGCSMEGGDEVRSHIERIGGVVVEDLYGPPPKKVSGLRWWFGG